MIQPQELRIGNYYQGASRGNNETVTWQTLRDLSEGKLNLLLIPLTEEILFNFGFESKGNFWFVKSGIKIEKRNNGFSYFRFREEIKILSIHQLQNLFLVFVAKNYN